MRKISYVLAGCLVLLLAAAPISAEPVDEVIAKHVEAHGGKANWDALKSLKATGSYRAFSKIHPFTMHRTQDNKYHFDTIMDDKAVTTGYDGQTMWWDNRWLNSGAQEISGADLAVAQRDVEFRTPLMDYKEKGHKVELLGTVDLEGIETIGIELTREDESVEKWYLDPKTYLEVGRDSPGSDFGRAMEQRTFYDDFREVAGVVIPHFAETQWYTRDRVMQIEKIEANIAIDEELFKMPLPPGMGPLRTLAGSFKVAAAQRQQPGAPWQESEYESSIKPLLRGGLMQETYKTADGNDVVRSVTYDSFAKRYRLTQINGATTQLDVQEGDFDENGKLVLSNVETGTTWSGFGMTFNNRVSISEITDNGFKLEQEISTDGGENWFLAVKAAYTRSEE